MKSHQRVQIEVTGTVLRIRAASPGRPILRTLSLERPQVRPFLKWAGGKQWLAAAAPHFFTIGRGATYYEPFLGGGSFFFALRAQAILSDSNRELIETYQTVKDDVERVVAKLRAFQYNAKAFAKVRASRPTSPAAVAARMIYLNKTAFNGLYRVNGLGEFNVPFGRFESPSILQPDRLRAAARTLEQASLLCSDFEGTCVSAASGDVVYFDPPYITGHLNNGFLRYNARLFSWRDQERLAKLARNLRDRGVRVVVSNADHPDVVALFGGFFHYSLVRRSLIGSSDSRGKSREALLTSYPIADVPAECIDG